jgi:hypothetical protein
VVTYLEISKSIFCTYFSFPPSTPFVLHALPISSFSNYHHHDHLDFLFSECIKLLGLIRSITFRFSSLDCLYVLYFMLFRSKLEYASVVWNSITSTDANKPERIQQKFASVCFYPFFPSDSFTFTLEKSSLHPFCKRRHQLDAPFWFRCIVALNPALSSWKMLVFVFLLAMLWTPRSLVLVPLINTVLLLGAPMLPTWWVEMSTYLQSEPFLLIIFYNFLPKNVKNICT